MMKTLRYLSTFVLLISFAFVSVGMATFDDTRMGHSNALGQVEITLQNKCTRDVSYSTSKSGATTKGVIANGSKVKLSLETGTAINVDGEVFMTVSDADNGQTFQACR